MEKIQKFAKYRTTTNMFWIFSILFWIFSILFIFVCLLFCILKISGFCKKEIEENPEIRKIHNNKQTKMNKTRLRWGWVFFLSCHQNDFCKDPQVEPKFCRSLLTTKFVDVAPVLK